MAKECYSLRTETLIMQKLYILYKWLGTNIDLAQFGETNKRHDNTKV